MAIPVKVATRLSGGLKKFQPIVEAAKSRDVNESDTVVIVTDLLQEIFGYDKYAEITSEHMIRSTFCDLAVKIDGKLAVLIEVKAIGLELKDQYVKQAVDYAANQGCEWVALTSGTIWRVYRVQFAKPIAHELIVEFNLLELNHRSESDLELLWLLAKEGWQKARLGEYAAQKEALSRFSIAAVILSSAILDGIRRELRRISPDIRIESQEIERVLREEVLKRDVLEGDKAQTARALVSRASRRALRTVKSDEDTPQETSPDPQ
jgi:predicted type IV restriction endonuclease